MTVTSSIDTISFASPHPTSVTFTNPRDVDYHFNFRVLVKDAYGNGVFGKTASSVSISELKSSKTGMSA